MNSESLRPSGPPGMDPHPRDSSPGTRKKEKNWKRRLRDREVKGSRGATSPTPLADRGAAGQSASPRRSSRSPERLANSPTPGRAEGRGIRADRSLGSDGPPQALPPAALGTPPRRVQIADGQPDRVLVVLSTPVAVNSASMDRAGQANPAQRKDKKSQKKGRGKGMRHRGKGKQD